MDESVIVDIDETLIDTSLRKKAAWKLVLGVNIPIEAIDRNPSRKVLEIYAPDRLDQWIEFWRTLLCYESDGVLLLSLDRPILGAVEIFNNWAREYRIIYLTGRTRNMKEHTLAKLNNLGFPTNNIEIMMSTHLEDFLNDPLRVRNGLLSDIASRNKRANHKDYKIFYT